MIRENQEYFELDPQKLLVAYARHWWLILLCTVAAGVLSLYVTLTFISPQYTAGVMVYVNNSRADQTVEYISGSNLSASKQLVNTYVNIIRSDTVLEKVVQASDLEDVTTASSIRRMMSASQVEDTEMFRVNITHSDPAAAAQIANAVAVVAPGEIERFVEGSSTKIIDYAKVPTRPSSPNVTLNCVLGTLMGCAAVLIFLTLRFMLDVRIKGEEDLNALFDLSILAQVPAFVPEGTKRRGYGKYSYDTSGKGGEQK